jgi:hypothetical protein
MFDDAPLMTRAMARGAGGDRRRFRDARRVADSTERTSLAPLIE